MKTKIAVIVVALILAVLVGCGVKATHSQENSLKIWLENENGNYYTMKVVDDMTGVNYVVVGTDLGGGYRSVSICPRYNADGSLYVSK